METFYLICVILFVLITIISSAVKIPTAYYGVETVFGKRTGKKLEEGLKFKTPFFGKILLYPMSLRTYTFDGKESITVFSSDELEINIEGAVQIRPSYNNLLKFVEIPESTIVDGMKDGIEGGLGIIAGQEEAVSFIGYRKEIEYIINCVFCLERRPDYYINNNEDGSIIESMDTDSFKEYLGKVEDIPVSTKFTAEKKKKALERLQAGKWIFPSTTKTDEEGKKLLHILKFYQMNIPRVEKMLQIENFMEENSKIEEQYAVDIESFKLAKVSYSLKTKESLEKKKQAEKDLDAAELRQKQKIEVMKELIGIGVSANQASNDADAMVGIAPKQTIAGNVFPLVNLGGGKQ